ncbi:MAG: UMP kinase [Candidatus Jordarchaeales archaeon]
MRVVIKLGGSILQSKEGEINLALVKEYAKVIRQVKREGVDVAAVVVGGGAISRRFINYARNLNASEGLCDVIGIQATRLNGYLLIAAMGEDAYPTIPQTLDEVAQAYATGKTVIVGGLQPGQSTSAVAALVAERLGANVLLNATDVEGVFTSDPKKDPNAKIIPELSVKCFGEIIMSKSHIAGKYELFDLVALKIVERSKVKVVIFNGKQPENMIRIIKGEKVGTVISPEQLGDSNA